MLLLTKCVFGRVGVKLEELVPVPNVLESDITRHLVRLPALDQIEAVSSLSKTAIFIQGGSVPKFPATTTHYHLSHSIDVLLLPNFVYFIESSRLLNGIEIHFKRFNIHWSNGTKVWLSVSNLRVDITFLLFV
jgi:hypothetical protein